jgi:PIN domain nuclease of toxin-antitoxin system
VADRDHGVFVSSASAWEIATKHRLGKLDVASALVKDLAGFVAKAGFEPLSVSIAHAQKAGLWPQSHRDPFDRMLAAQAALEDMVLVTCDPALETFDVPRLW